MSDTAPKKRLSMRTRKLIGMVVLLFWMTIYTLVAAGLLSLIPQIDFLFVLPAYIIAGIAWVFPVKYLLNWMQAPEEQA